jgi:hypothetical protein
MIQLNNFKNYLKALVEANYPTICHFVLTASMFNALAITGNKTAFVVLPRTKKIELDRCDDHYKVQFYMGIKSQPTNEDFYQRVDALAEDMQAVLLKIRASEKIELVQHSDLTIFDDIEAITTKGYIYLNVDLTLKYFD